MRNFNVVHDSVVIVNSVLWFQNFRNLMKQRLHFSIGDLIYPTSADVYGFASGYETPGGHGWLPTQVSLVLKIVEKPRKKFQITILIDGRVDEIFDSLTYDITSQICVVK